MNKDRGRRRFGSLNTIIALYKIYKSMTLAWFVLYGSN
ncbi:hypothetical protein B0I18_107123 [Taibaiella chishuiensis]|uniref:Uncharacterized protein n=1 Tax=Taibaiella chishuiensis TaxID=1434707 RepID=A0A2P8D0G7_9BACT|nr:hypothetical protein B0I18_107123 [Taibaiella chishuiensis]